MFTIKNLKKELLLSTFSFALLFGIATLSVISAQAQVTGVQAATVIHSTSGSIPPSNTVSSTTPTSKLKIHLTSIRDIKDTNSHTENFKVTFDGNKYDPADVTLEFSCNPKSVSWTSVMPEGGKTNSCTNLQDNNTGLDMQRIKDGSYALTIRFYNTNVRKQLVNVVAKAWGGVNGKNLITSDRESVAIEHTNGPIGLDQPGLTASIWDSVKTFLNISE